MNVPIEKQLRDFGGLITYVLYEKTQPSPVYRALLSLVIERHKNFHDENVDWLECGNQKCKDMQNLLTNELMPVVELNPFVREMMKAYSFFVEPMGNGGLRFALKPINAPSPELSLEGLERPEPSGLKIIVPKNSS